MSLRPVIQPRSANGFGRRRVEKEVCTRMEDKLQPGKSESRTTTNAGELSGSKAGGYGTSSRDRLVYITTCFIGHEVEVQVKNGSIYSGIFHATNAEKDFGIILKMARLIKDCSLQGRKAISMPVSNTVEKVLIIPAKDLVQVMAKDVSITIEGLTNELQQDRQQEIMIDSLISQSRYAEMGRELERWVPDEDNPQCPELEDIFDGHWNRNWDQFETNEALFGVKSTFDEELYTTKLERGPQTKDREREASRIAREIEAEETGDFHLADERGIHFHQNFEIDEEAIYSSVSRGVVNGGYKENEDTTVDPHIIETFGGSSTSVTSSSLTEFKTSKSSTVAQALSSTSSMDEAHSSQWRTGRKIYHSNSNDHARQLSSDINSKTFPALNGENRNQVEKFSDQHGMNTCTQDFVDKQMIVDEAQVSNLDELHSSLDEKKDVSDKGLSADATAYAPASSGSTTGGEICSPELSESAVIGKTQGVASSKSFHGQPSNSLSTASDRVGAPSSQSGPSLSPSSSMASLCSEKSALNPHAKEFKLNPNAKSFVPSQAPLRPTSPMSDSSFYFPPNVPAVSHMHNMPLGFGVGTSFAAPQPVVYNQTATPMQTPQPYFHPNPQMIVGHPRQVLYMHGYPPDMPYKGRDF